MQHSKRDLESPPESGHRIKMPNVNRTPPRDTKNQDASDLLKNIQDMLTAQKQSMEEQFDRQRAETRASEERLVETVGLWMKGIESQLETLRDENRTLRDANSQLEEKMKQLARRQIQTERDTKQLNFVATGLSFDSAQEGFNKLQKLIDSHTDAKLKITGHRVVTIGDKKKIIGSCNNLSDKRALMNLKKKLCTEINGVKIPIYLDNDKPYEDREADRLVRLAAKEFTASGKEVRFEAGKLIVNGVRMRLNRETKTVEAQNFRT